MKKSRQYKTESKTYTVERYTCVVCGNTEVLYPYGILKNYRTGERHCVCCGDCNHKYLKGEYNHELQE